MCVCVCVCVCVADVSLQTEHLNGPISIYTLWRMCSSLTVTLKGTAIMLWKQTVRLLHAQPETSRQQIVVRDGEFQAGGWERTGWERFHIAPRLPGWLWLKESFVLCPGLASPWGLLVMGGRGSGRCESSSAWHPQGSKAGQLGAQPPAQD